jgi:hypothetical protein
MKQASQTLFSVLAVALVAGALLWKQQQEIQSLESRLHVADHELKLQQADHTELEKKFEDAKKQTGTLASGLSGAPQSGKPANSAEGKHDRGGAVSEEMLHQYLADANDPAVMRRLNTEARNQILRRFGDLLKQLNLPPDQNEALVKLLTDKRQVALDTAVASFQQGNDPSQDMDAYRDLMIANRDSIEGQINALLGPTNYA